MGARRVTDTTRRLSVAVAVAVVSACFFNPSGTAVTSDSTATATGESTSTSTPPTTGDTTGAIGGTSDATDGDGTPTIHGGLDSLGARSPAVGGYRVVGDGFMRGSRTCGGDYCVRGGILP